MKKIRKAAVAGLFYPKEAQTLKKLVSRFLEKADFDFDLLKKPKIIIVPHAGYDFSGQTAAYAYKLVERFSYKKFILLGPAHYYPIETTVTANFVSWETPLGKVNVEKNLQKSLALPILNEAFLPEHSLEVQLPFLQTIFSHLPFFPILTNSYDALLLQRLCKVYSDNTLYVISSDLSHYLPENLALKKDETTIEIIIKKNVEKEDQIEACGEASILIAMHLARSLNLEGMLLFHDTSATYSSDYTSVVGYASICFS